MPPRCSEPRCTIIHKSARKSAPSVRTQQQPKHQKPAKRKRTAYDLEDTFEVLVGKPRAESKSFTIHTDVFTGRSGVLGKTEEPQAPVDLKAEDPELFQAYLNCVYFGAEIIEQWSDELQSPVRSDNSEMSDEALRAKELAADVIFKKMIRLYLLAERLVDFKTANIVTREMIRLSDAVEIIPTQISTSLAYAATAAGNPLRKLLRDFWIYNAADNPAGRIRAAGFPLECLQDIATEMLRIRYEGDSFRYTVGDLCLEEVCRYHQHDDKHPRCVPEPIYSS